MTALLERPAVAVRPAAARRAGSLALAVLPWALVAVTLVSALRLTGTPAADIAAYAAYWALTIVLPGTLVHRALRGSRGNLPEDVGFGAAVGLLLELIAWASSAALGGQGLLRWWALPVVIAFVAVPGWRRHWRVAAAAGAAGDRVGLPARWAWAIAGVMLLVIGWACIYWTTTPLPPVDAAYYQDLMYHLALVQELTRSMPFEVPQLAGDTLRYHYLSDAHMATASMITGVSPATVLLRVWIVPVAATAVLVIAGITRDLTGRWWAGPLAGAVAFAGMPLDLGAPVEAFGTGSLSFASPSQTYAMPLLLLLAALAVDVLRGRRPDAAPAGDVPRRRSLGAVLRGGPLGVGWVLVPLLALACAGAKSSALPPLLAGLLLAAAVRGWRDRRVPWAVLGFAGVVIAAMAVGYRIFAGGGAGTLGVQPLSVLRWMDPYLHTLGEHDGIDQGGFLPIGVDTASTRGWIFVIGMTGWWMLMQAPRLIGLVVLGERRTRVDPVAWLLGGGIVAATGAAWCLYHPSASQLYFFLCGAPFGAILSVWLLAAHVRDRSRRGWVAVVGLLAGAVWTFVAPEVAVPERETLPTWERALALPVLRTLIAILVVAVAALVVHALMRWYAAHRRGSRAGFPRTSPGGVAANLLVGVTAAVLGGSVAAGAAQTDRVVFGPPAEAPLPARIVTAAEMRAALWLDAHAAADDVVATNVHCQPVARSKPCDARAFWVAGLGGHRTLVESWGYSDATVAANGRNGLKYPLQPAPDAELFARNERIFTAPTAGDLDELRRTRGVRWLLADNRAGQVSPELATLATVRFTAGPATVYELRSTQ